MASHSTVSAFTTLLSRALFSGPQHSVNLAVHHRHRVLLDGAKADGKIVATTKIKGNPSNVPTYAKVRLYRDIGGALVAETWSDPTTGTYSFIGIDKDFSYTVVAYDPQLVYRAVIADGVTPEAL